MLDNVLDEMIEVENGASGDGIWRDPQSELDIVVEDAEMDEAESDESDEKFVESAVDVKSAKCGAE